MMGMMDYFDAHTRVKDCLHAMWASEGRDLRASWSFAKYWMHRRDSLRDVLVSAK